PRLFTICVSNGLVSIATRNPHSGQRKTTVSEPASGPSVEWSFIGASQSRQRNFMARDSRRTLPRAGVTSRRSAEPAGRGSLTGGRYVSVKLRRRCSSVAEPLIRNQQVAGSSPAAGSSSHRYLEYDPTPVPPRWLRIGCCWLQLRDCPPRFGSRPASSGRRDPRSPESSGVRVAPSRTQGTPCAGSEARRRCAGGRGTEFAGARLLEQGPPDAMHEVQSIDRLPGPVREYPGHEIRLGRQDRFATVER